MDSTKISDEKIDKLSLFSQIIEKKIPAILLYQDAWVTAFEDKYPQALVHFLVVPNRPIKSLLEVTEKDERVLGRMLQVAASEARKKGLTEGFRLIVNTGVHGGQEIMHLHLHVLGGEPIGPMLHKPDACF